MKTTHPYPLGGYVALLSTFIIATLLTVLIFAAGTSAFFARFDTLDYEDHVRAQHLARSCVYAALYSLTRDHEYKPPVSGSSIAFDLTDTCRIQEVLPAGAVTIVRTSATAGHANSTVEAYIRIPSSDALPILYSWKEINSL